MTGTKLTLDVARVQVRIAERARTLFYGDGYSYAQSRDYPQVFLIYKPDSLLSDYAVDVQTNFCTCKAFEHYDTCKHLIAVREELGRDEAMIARWEEEGGAHFDEWKRAVHY